MTTICYSRLSLGLNRSEVLFKIFSHLISQDLTPEVINKFIKIFEQNEVVIEFLN